MKNILNFRPLVALGVMALVALGSCKKDSDDTTPKLDDTTPKLIASMGATINAIVETDGTTIVSSTQWSAISRVSIMKGDVLTITGTALSFTGIPDVINVTIYGTTEGTYKLGIADVAAQCGAGLVTKYNEATATFVSTSGTVELTKVDKSARIISGTYEFSLFSGGVIKTITNGKFENLKYDVK